MNDEARELRDLLLSQATRGRRIGLGLDDREIFVEYRLHDLINLMHIEVNRNLDLMFTDAKAGQVLYDTRYQHDCIPKRSRA